MKEKKKVFNNNETNETNKEDFMWETILGQVIGKANNYKAVPDKGGRRRIIKMERIKKYESNFVAQCTKYKGANIDYPFCLFVNVFNVSNLFDLDNALKTILDCLQDCKAISNDNLCAKIVATKDLDRERPRVEFKIERFEPPEIGIFAKVE